MFKPAHKVQGYLLDNIVATANVISLNPDAYNKLVAVIGEAGVDHTYLLLDAGDTSKEAVKVLSASAGLLVVERARDGTIALDFPVNTKAAYLLAADAVQDMMAAHAGLTVNITGTGVAAVTSSGPNQFNVNVPPTVITSANGSLNITGNNPFDATVNTVALGCCDNNASSGGGGL